ncbi:MAG: YchF/TatD family DNA exonuclease [Candidatus Dasytiphilus stammeri]
MFLVDSHCHLNKLNYNTIHKNLDEVLHNSFVRDIKYFLSVATSLSDYREILKLVGNNSRIVYSCGLHPLETHEKNHIYQLRSVVTQNSKIVALGETGLDYYYHSNNKKNQQLMFREHIQIARELEKPLIVHTRNAKNDTIRILTEHKSELCKGVIHCFTEDREMAKKMLDLGFYISFSGIITFRNSQDLRQIVRYVPLDHILIESDCPYLSPVPYRGKENQPAWVQEIAKCVAQIKNISLADIAKATTNNFQKLFNLTISNLNQN